MNRYTEDKQINTHSLYIFCIFEISSGKVIQKCKKKNNLDINPQDRKKGTWSGAKSESVWPWPTPQ